MSEELREISNDELREILRRHKEWVDSGGAKGEEADLSGVNLRGANLSETELSGVALWEADLHGANLHSAGLRGAHLSEANLSGADLMRADFEDADLEDADLSGADLSGASLTDADLSGANLCGALLIKAVLINANLLNANLIEARLWDADLSGAHLWGADLWGANLLNANLSGADLWRADLWRANLRAANLGGANLRAADLHEADLENADLSGANLSGADLQGTRFVRTSLAGCSLEGAKVYGISVWDVETDERTNQQGLIITPDGASEVRVDDLDVAQFIYLLLTRQKLRDVIDTITSKAVLILGRFTPVRKAVLDAMAEELRRHGYLPIIFDFDRPTSRDFTETIRVLAGLSSFVIVDLTNPKSAPLELQATVPDYQIPFVPILQAGEEPFSMFPDLLKYDWVLQDLIEYSSQENLIEAFEREIIEPALAKRQELLERKVRTLRRKRV